MSELLHGLAQLVSDTSITLLPTDEEEEKLVNEFMTSGCACTKANGKQCLHQFSIHHVKAVRSSCFELSHEQLDMLLIGQLLVCMNNSSTTSMNKRKEAAREKSYCSFTHQGKPVCIRTFTFLHGIGRKRLRNIITSLKRNGVTPHIHGNYKRQPWNSLSLQSIEYVVRFLFNYAEQHALLFPGRVPGYICSDLQLLPSSSSKRTIWKLYYKAAVAEGTIHSVAYTPHSITSGASLCPLSLS